jgi:cytoplasmic iron level regulating protein YaaA (DUF328/UPF0246 family)
MLLILPPSESKRTGGSPGEVLDLGRLSFPELTETRRAVLKATRALARNLQVMAGALKLGPNQQHELQRNREIATSPVMPAIDRFTGVLFDALGADTLSVQQREYAAHHVVVHSALFGLLGALDPIPAYRLSHDSRLPGVSLKKAWGAPISRVLAEREGIILDLRSEAYAALGPAPQRDGSYFVRVVADDGAGRRRALNHFNKKGKGEFVRALVKQQPAASTIEQLCEWSSTAGFPLSPGAPGELELVVNNTV